MNRDEAIAIILKTTIEDLSKEEREEILIDWWGIDQDDPEFDKLPEILQSEILNYDEPQKDVMDEVYSALLLVALRKKYLGVRNEYLSKRVSLSWILIRRLRVCRKNFIVVRVVNLRHFQQRVYTIFAQYAFGKMMEVQTQATIVPPTT